MMPGKPDALRKLHDLAIAELQGAIADLKLSRDGRSGWERFALISEALFKAHDLIRAIRDAEKAAKATAMPARSNGENLWTRGGA